MKDFELVNAEDLKTLEEYGASLLCSIASLKTLEAFHISAFNKGLLDADEAETGKTIIWEIQRLVALYKTQIENIMDRTEISEDAVLQKLKQLMPELKIPRKQKNIKKKGNDERK